MSGHYRPSIIQWILLQAEKSDLFILQNENKELKQPQNIPSTAENEEIKREKTHKMMFGVWSLCMFTARVRFGCAEKKNGRIHIANR